MTSIIKQIETKSLNVNTFIKKNSSYILNESVIIGSKKDTMKADDFRNWVFTTNEIDIKFMFDEKGKPNKKGEVKKIMSQHYKNVMNGIMAIYNNQDMFVNWVNDNEYKKGNNVTSLSKMSNNLTQYNNYLNPSNNETEETETETEETETEETEDNNSRSKILEKMYDFIYNELLPHELEDLSNYCLEIRLDKMKKIVNK
mgnify:FL=1